MARQARIQYKGALYHLTARGNAQQDIYRNDEDRIEFLDILRKARNRYNCTIYAYCLMSNHYHLLVETPDGNLSQFMRQLNGVYTQKFNAAHKQTGHIFEGRYKSILVQKDLYLLELARYIVLNPVRAGMVRSAREWPWSSYKATGGLIEKIDWVDSDWLLSNFSKKRTLAEKTYRKFVSEGRKQPKPWEKIRNQVYLGDESFTKKSMKKIANTASRDEIPSIQSKPRPKAKSMQAYVKQSTTRNEAIEKIYLSGGYSMKEIGVFLGVHYSTISRVISAR